METSDKRRLRIVSKVQKHNTQKGTLVFLQGMEDSCERYGELFYELSRRGFSYASFDWYGQGASVPDVTETKKKLRLTFDINQHIGDLDEFLQKIVYPDCPPPYYFLAYDMGCLVGISALNIINNQCQRFIGLSPLFTPFGYTTGSFQSKLTSLMTDFGLGRLKLPRAKSLFANNSGLTTGRDSEISRLKKSHNIRLPDRSWLAQVLETVNFAKARLHKNDLRFPTFFVLGHNDKLINAQKSLRFCNNVRLADTMTLFGAGHDILNGSDNLKKQFWALFDTFIPGTKAYDINY
ncbi:alpha/beta fold hydrolase [Bartonella sp. M0177]|uniref:alpha/beta fold hydrolase n=1 Tax=Bartonella sp. M0177 TaxID=2750940 RepID=UPI0018DE22BC|nr:alpha/beta fold hydrolase [Bartonella sp. M0177]MBI0003416.1 alpha/beta fold hydrolase [Bartonella sp. M0177]